MILQYSHNQPFSKNPGDYGIPEVSQFPINTKENVFRAISCFTYCREPQRHILANAIKNKMDEFKIDKVSVEDNNSIIYHLPKECMEILSSEVNENFKLLKDNELYKILTKPVNGINELDTMSCLLRTLILNPHYIREDCNIYHISNSILVDRGIVTRNAYNYIRNIKNDDSLFFDHLLTDITEAIIKRIIHQKTLDIKLKNALMLISCCLSYDNNSDYTFTRVALSFRAINHELNKVNLFNCHISIDMDEYEIDDENSRYIAYDNIMNSLYDLEPSELLKTTAYMKQLADEIGNEIDIISMSNKYKSSNYDAGINKFEPTIYDYISNYNMSIEDLKDKFWYKVTKFMEDSEGMFNQFDKYSMFLKQYSLTPDVSTISKIIAKRYSNNLSYSNLFYFNDIDGNHIYCLANNREEKLYFLASSDERRNCVYFVEVDFTIEPIEFGSVKKVSPESFMKLEAMTEGLSIDEDGTVKITFNKKSSFMEEYVDNHKLLKECKISKNYEEMKLLIAYDFALISRIDNLLKGKTKNLNDKEKELLNAKAFLMNDFKTYLKEIVAVEPKFNFTDYYRNCEEIKTVIKIDTKTISGIKLLLRTILMK